jgi:hypothetical protein
MASSKQQQAESPEDELPQDQNTDAGDLAPADPEIAKAEAATKAGVLAAMEGTTGALHAVHARLQEMKPFLTGAIEQADGKLKDFLVSLHAAF